MFPPALAIQQANDATPGTVPKISGGARVLASSPDGSSAVWTDPATGLNADALLAISQAPVGSVLTPPGWLVIGSFNVPAAGNYVLDVIGLVSDITLTLNVQLYCTTPGHIGLITGSLVTLLGTNDADAESHTFALAAARRYQVWAQVYGNAGVDYFGTVRRAVLRGV